MEFSVPAWAVYTASWFGMLAGVWSLFDRAETVVGEQTKQSVSKWLQNLRMPNVEPWPIAFRDIFVQVFGEKHFSWRCVAMSVLASLMFLAILLGFWVGIHPAQGLAFFAAPVNWFVVLLSAGIFNLLPDYVSLFETRIVLRQLAKNPSLRWTVSLIVFDFVLTGFIFFAAIAAYAFLMGWTNIWETVLSGLIMGSTGDTGPSLGPFIYTTYATSLWLWLYVLSGTITRLFKVADKGVAGFKFIFDLENKPIRSLGFVSMFLVSVAYLAVPLWSAIAQ